MPPSPDPPGLGHQLCLIGILSLGVYLGAATLALLLFGGSETLETLLYLGAFALLPGAVVAGSALARQLGRTETLEAVTLVISIGLLLLVVTARGIYALSGGATVGTPGFAAAFAVWVVGSIVLVRFAPDRGPLALPSWMRSRRRGLRALTGVLCLTSLLGFPPSRVLGPGELLAGLALAGLLLGTYLLLMRRHPGRRWGAALDLLAMAVLLLLANNVRLYADPDQFYTITSNLHQNFYLGPANDVLHGRPMLVDTFSQYGVVLFYALAVWFKISAIGYGAMTLLSALLTAAEIAAVYVILRLARASRPLAFAAGAVAGIALFFAGTLPPPTSHPSTGGLRYLLPYLVVAAGVAGARFPQQRRRWWWTAAALVGLSSVWSVETFGYSSASFAGMAAYRALTAGGLRALLHALFPALVTVCVAHVSFAVLTFFLAGSWPAWDGYLAFLGSYSVDGISALPIEPWSPGIVITGGYIASIAGLILLTRDGDAVIREERPALLAIAGIVPFGVVSFTYFIGNSFPDAALSVGLPSYVAAALWLALVERRRSLIAPGVRGMALALAAWLVAVVAVFAWPTIERRAGDTPLAMALPDSGRGGSLTNEVTRMWRSDPLDARYAPAEALVHRYFPGGGPVLTAATTENAVTVLMETDRVNAFPVSHFLQEGLVMDRAWPRVRAKIDSLPPGTLLLTERQALDRLYPAPLLDRTIAKLRRRFRFQFVGGDSNGFFVVRLVPHRR